MKSKRYDYFDGLRVISAILVVLLHCGTAVYYSYPNIDESVANVVFIMNGFTRVAVSVFFMISGALTLESEKNISISYVLKKRVSKLIVILIVFSSISYFIDVLILGNENIGIKELIKAFFSNKIDYRFWFLYQLIGLYLSLPILRIVVEKLERKYLWYMVVLALIATNLKYTLDLRYGAAVYFRIPIVGEFIGVFILGYLLNSTTIIKKHRIIIYILGILGVLQRIYLSQTISLSMDGINIEWLNDKTFNVLFSSIAFFIFAKQSKVFDKFSKISIVKTLSKISLGIYLIHPIVISIFLYKMNWYILTPSKFIILILVAIIIPILLSYILSKIKYLNNLVS